jgi:hypothetical protein
MRKGCLLGVQNFLLKMDMIRILLWKLERILKIAFSQRDRSGYPILCLSTSVADPAFHFDSYPNLTFHLMRIQIHCEPPQLHCDSSGPQGEPP